MADSILRLRVESQEYDNKLKRAAEGLQRYADGCRSIVHRIIADLFDLGPCACLLQ